MKLSCRPPPADPLTWAHPRAILSTLVIPLSAPATRLHIGAGNKRLADWINVDLLPLPGVDVVADVTAGLQFSDVEAIFAEHFLEHLRLDKALDFLCEAHRILRPGAWMRLSTPNLDWVWITQYTLHAEPDAKVDFALRLNRSFHAWGHQFLWNRELLERALLAAGFAELTWCTYGNSPRPLFTGLERHETYGDTPELPHVLIVEARKAEPQPEALAELRQLSATVFLYHLLL
jgi:predicted SAM-dependent methyltransferase